MIRLKYCLDDFCPEEIRTGRKADTGPIGEHGCPLCSFLIMYYLFVLALNCSDCYNAYDIVCGASTGQIVDRSCDTLGNRAVCFCLCQSLNELVTDVACIQVRENQDICMTCHFAARSLCLTYTRNDRRVKLHLTIQLKVRILLSCNLRSLYDFVYQCMLCASLVEWERNATFGSAPTRERKDSAEDAAIAASSSGFGS